MSDTWGKGKASNRAPTVATIERWCTTYHAIAILRDRGAIGAGLADDLAERETARINAAYDRLYGRDEVTA